MCVFMYVLCMCVWYVCLYMCESGVFVYMYYNYYIYILYICVCVCVQYEILFVPFSFSH